jgi:putative mRNA 3-end processing factor
VDAIENTTWIRNQGDRKRALDEPCVVISPAGMLVGGNAVFYLQELAFDRKNGIALVSYQGEGTPGRKLLETGKIQIRGKEKRAEAMVRQFEFSGHSDRNALFELVKKIQGNPKVLTIHGDGQSCVKFAQEIHEQFGFDAHAPQSGEIISI